MGEIQLVVLKKKMNILKLIGWAMIIPFLVLVPIAILIVPILLILHPQENLGYIMGFVIILAFCFGVSLIDKS